MKFTRPLLLSVLFLAGCATPGDDGPSVSNPAFSHSLGSARAQDTGGTCSIGLSAPSGSALKNQQINFVLSGGSMGNSAQEFPVATGSSKSLAALQTQLGTALHHGLTAPAGSELAKVGDIKYGGEVRVVARGGGKVDFLYLPAIEGGNPKLSPGETAAFARLLGQ